DLAGAPGYALAVSRQERLVEVPGDRPGAAPQWQRPGTPAGALSDQSRAEVYDPGSGPVGGRSRTEPVCRPLQEVDHPGPVAEVGATQCRPELGGDVMGPVEKWQRVPPGMGG